LGVATIGVVLMAFLVWIIYRSRIVGRGAIEYLVMFPQAVPRLVFGLALLWAWLNIPIPIYGTLWLLAIAYLTVMLPLGVRTLAGVVLQIDKSLEECAQMCGAPWTFRQRTITVPLLAPGLIAAWLLLLTALLYGYGRAGWWTPLLVVAAAVHLYVAYCLTQLDHERRAGGMTA